MEIVVMIVKNLDFTRRLIVRKTCKTLRKMIDRLEPCCCKELQMTIGLEECELKLEGHSIKYKKSGEGTYSMLTKMLDDLSSFLSHSQSHLDTFIINQNNVKDFPQTIFIKGQKEFVSESLSVLSLDLQAYEIWHLPFWREEIKCKELHISYLRILEKLEDDIMRVEVKTRKCNADAQIKSNYCTKYYREGQMDILVDEPVSLLFCVMVSITLLFETRFFILYASDTPWRHFRRPWLLLNYSIALLGMIPTYLSIPDQQSGKTYQLGRYPCLPAEVYEDRVFLLSTWSTGVALNSLLNTTTQQTILFISLIYCNMKKSMSQVKMSKKTIDLHRKFMRSLVLQVAIPVATVILPLSYNTLATLYSYYNQGANNISVSIMATHGLVSSLAMVYLHKSYWEVLTLCPRMFFVEDTANLMSNLNITSSSKIPPNICDLPIEAVEIIVKNLDFMERLIVRETCKPLRDIINRGPLYCKELTITIGLEECELKIEGHSIKYKRSGEGFESMLMSMTDDLSSFVFDPQFQLDTFIFKNNTIFNAMIRTIYPGVHHEQVAESLYELSIDLDAYDNLQRSFWTAGRIKLREFQGSFLYNPTILDDDIMKVEMKTRKFVAGVRPTLKYCTKYFREGQMDILVDEPRLLPPKKATPP
uniref:F-box domain-containing protein n=1 Tax=Caenorhabditis tropicalis TaxID=1561998 RepID=A0A1I7UEV1_9PELO